jgi:hypothetical protein
MIKECKGACLFLEIIIGIFLVIVLFAGCITIIGIVVTFTYRFTGRLLSPPATTIKVLEMAAAKNDETRLTSVSITEIRTSSNPITEAHRPRRGTVAIEQINDFDNTL